MVSKPTQLKIDRAGVAHSDRGRKQEIATYERREEGRQALPHEEVL